MLDRLLIESAPGALVARITRRLVILACFAAVLGVPATLASIARAVPDPAPVPRRWEFQLEPGPLRLTTVEVPGKGWRPYWYFTFKVTNNTGEDRFFAPSFEMSLDNGEVMLSGRNVPRQVTETILQRLNNPLLIDEIAIQGTMLQGPENAKEGLVIWPADDLRVDVLRVFAAGFSGETYRYTRPDNGEQVTLRKQLMLPHQLPGEANPQSDDPIKRVGQRWVLR